MKKIKYYILTSDKISLLKRHFSKKYSNIPKEDAVVVINTLDEKYFNKAKSFCLENDIEFYRTECDGTAAKGKNSVLELFLKSDNEYMVHIDGDDYLTPHGVWVYNHLSNSESPPDAVFLWRQKGFCKYYEDDFHKVEKSNPYCIHYGILDDPNYFNLFKMSVLEDGWSNESIDEYILLTRGFWEFQSEYCEPYTQHCRLTFLSRKAASIKFPEGISVGEDTLHYYLLKNENKMGKLNVFRNSEYPPTYIYDQTNSKSTVVKETDGGQDCSWIKKWLEIANKYKESGIVHKGYELPDLKVDYPCGYIVDDCGYDSDLCYFDIFENDGTKSQIYYPMNASDSSIIAEKNRLKNKGNGYVHNLSIKPS